MINKIPQKFQGIWYEGDDFINSELHEDDIKWRLSSLIDNPYYNISIDKNIEIRSFFLNHSKPLHETKHVDLVDDIFYFKLLTLGLVEIRFFFFEYNEESSKGKELYEFMSDFQIRLDTENERGIAYNTGLGRVQYDINEIVKNHYNKFVTLLYEVIDEEHEEITEDNVDYAFEDRVTMEVIIPDGQKFILQAAKILAKKKKAYKDMQEMLMRKYNENGASSDKVQKISIPSSNLLGNPHYVSLLNYLDEKGKIKLEGIFKSDDKAGIYHILYTPYVYILTNIHFNRYEEFIFEKEEAIISNRKTIEKSYFKDSHLHIDTESFKLTEGKLPHAIIKMLYDIKSDTGLKINYSDMNTRIINSNSEYTLLKNTFGYVSKGNLGNELRKVNDRIAKEFKKKGIKLEEFFGMKESFIELDS